MKIDHLFRKLNFFFHLLLTLFVLGVEVLSAQTVPNVSVTTTSRSILQFQLGALSGNTSIQVDWGDGIRKTYLIGTEPTTLKSPSPAKGNDNISLYCPEIHFLDITGQKVTKLNLDSNLSLAILKCGDNLLRSLSVSGIPQLKQLFCDRNLIASIDLTKNSQLEKLDCGHNQISVMDFSQNTKLLELICCNNRFSKLNIGSNTLLKLLNCDVNELSELNLENNMSVESLSCSDNYLSKIDLSKNMLLKSLDCSNNQLDALNISLNKYLTDIDCSDNALTFSTLPIPSEIFKTYRYSPQNLRYKSMLSSGEVVDLTRYLYAKDNAGMIQTTVFTWKIAGRSLIEGIDYQTISPGRFKFKEVPGHLFYCDLSNSVFPDFKDQDIFRFAYFMEPVVTMQTKLTEGFSFIVKSEIDSNLLVVEYGSGSYFTKSVFQYIPPGNQISPVKIYGQGLKKLHLNDLKLTGLSLSDSSKLAELHCKGNYLCFATLPRVDSKYTSYIYAPQHPLIINKSAETAKAIDLSSQAVVNDFTGFQHSTLYSWKTKGEKLLIEDIDYLEPEAGKFIFLKAPPDSIYCTLFNEAFPDFTGLNGFKTTFVKISETTNLLFFPGNSDVQFDVRGTSVTVIFPEVPSDTSIHIYDFQGRSIGSWPIFDRATSISVGIKGMMIIEIRSAGARQIKKLAVM